MPSFSMRRTLCVAVLLVALFSHCASFQRESVRRCIYKSTSSLYLEKKRGPPTYQYNGPSSGPPPELASFSSGGRRIPGLKKEAPSSGSTQHRKPTDETKGAKRSYKDRKAKVQKGPDDNIDDLEKIVLAKYGPNALRESLLDEWDEDEVAAVKKAPVKPKKGRFEGFGGFVGSSDESGSLATTEPTEDDEEDDSVSIVETVEAPISSKPRSLLLGRLRKVPAPSSADALPEKKTSSAAPISVKSTSSSTTTSSSSSSKGSYSLEDAFDEEPAYSNPKALRAKADKLASMTGFDDYEGEEREEDGDGDISEEPRSGPLNAAGGFRLRRPPPVSPEEQAKLDAKAAALAARELEQQEKRKLKRQLEKNEYLPFSFEDEEETAESDQIFTSKTFSDIGVSDKIILRNLERMGIFNPTKIQEAAIPEMLSGKDVVLYAQTGSGKTLSFLLPLVNVVDPSVRKVQAVVLAPSRELVTQIGLVGEALFKGTAINLVTLIGGANVRNQIKRLRDTRPQIIVATPGRLAELVFRLQKLRLGMVRAMVVDEVDNLLQDAFAGEVQTIFESTPLFTRMSGRVPAPLPVPPSARQEEGEYVDDYVADDEVGVFDDDEDTDDNEEEEEAIDNIPEHLNKRMVCLASATGNNAAVKDFADRYLAPGWSRVSVTAASALPVGITHGLISTPRIKALDMLKKFLNAKPEVKSALIFVNDPHRVEIVYEKLLEMGFIAAPLHGDTSKDDRKEILARLRDGRLNLVVTTELAARGIDIPDLTHVVNFELPTDAQHYVHRAGRCGRAGRKGLVMNFANPDTKFVIRRFGKQLGVKVRDCEIREGKICLKAK